MEPRPFESRHGCVLWWDFIGPFYRYSTWTEGLWRKAQIRLAVRDQDFERFKTRVLESIPGDIPK